MALGHKGARPGPGGLGGCAVDPWRRTWWRADVRAFRGEDNVYHRSILDACIVTNVIKSFVHVLHFHFLCRGRGSQGSRGKGEPEQGRTFLVVAEVSESMQFPTGGRAAFVIVLDKMTRLELLVPVDLGAP